MRAEPPLVQDLRDVREAVSGRGQPEDEVVVLRAIGVAVAADGLEGGAAHHQRGVGDRTLHEQVALDRGGVGETVEPRLVAAVAGGGRGAREVADAGPAGGDVGALGEEAKLGGEAPGAGDVVGVHAGDERGPRTGGQAAQGGDDARAVAADDAHAGIAPGPGAQERTRAIPRPVVEGEHLVAPLGLRLEARDALGQERRRVAARQQDGDERRPGRGHDGPLRPVTPTRPARPRRRRVRAPAPGLVGRRPSGTPPSPRSPTAGPPPRCARPRPRVRGPCR